MSGMSCIRPRAPEELHCSRVSVSRFLAADDGADELLGDLVERGRLADPFAVSGVTRDVAVARGDRNDARSRRPAITVAAAAPIASDVDPVSLVTAGGIREVDGAVRVGEGVDVGRRGRRKGEDGKGSKDAGGAKQRGRL